MPHPYLAQCAATMGSNMDEVVRDWAADLTTAKSKPSQLVVSNISGDRDAVNPRAQRDRDRRSFKGQHD